MSDTYLTFMEAYEYCQSDGAWPVMIKTSDDLTDIVFYSSNTWTEPILKYRDRQKGVAVC